MSDSSTYKTQPVKGKNFHEYNGIKYDVDTFYDKLCWEEIFFDRDKHPHHRIWGYSQDMFPCPSCNQSSDVQFNIQTTGVMMKCKYCQITMPAPPFDVENGSDIAELLLDETISVEKAFEIAAKIGQALPIQPPRGSTRRKASFNKKPTKSED